MGHININGFTRSASSRRDLFSFKYAESYYKIGIQTYVYTIFYYTNMIGESRRDRIAKNFRLRNNSIKFA